MTFFKICCFMLLLVAVQVHGVKELLRFEDLRALGSSTHMVRDWFYKTYGAKAGISLNYGGVFGAVKPPTTVQYGRWCYKTIGPVKYVGRASNPRSQLILLKRSTIVNNTPQPVRKTIRIDASWEQSISHTTSNTLGLEFSSGVTVAGLFSYNLGFNFQTTTSESKINKRTQSSSQSVTITVPPRSKRTVYLRGTRRIEDARYQAPITVSGWFGANFGKRIRGHYFWFASASRVLPKTTGIVNIIVKGITVVNIHTTVS